MILCVDFLLARNQVRGPEPASDRRNVLYGLLMARVPVPYLSFFISFRYLPLSFIALKSIFMCRYLSLSLQHLSHTCATGHEQHAQYVHGLGAPRDVRRACSH